MEMYADMLTLVLYGILVTRPYYQVKFTYLVGSMFILSIAVKYLSDYRTVGVVMHLLAIILWCFQHYFYFKHRNAESKN